MVDEKECNRGIAESIDISVVCNDILDCPSMVGCTLSEINSLRETYEKLAHEERLRDDSVCLSPLFGAYVYLWTIKSMDYNEIIQTLGVPIYEGNFLCEICSKFTTFAKSGKRLQICIKDRISLV